MQMGGNLGEVYTRFAKVCGAVKLACLKLHSHPMRFLNARGKNLFYAAHYTQTKLFFTTCVTQP
jgi:hypothetical protein